MVVFVRGEQINERFPIRGLTCGGYASPDADLVRRLQFGDCDVMPCLLLHSFRHHTLHGTAVVA